MPNVMSFEFAQNLTWREFLKFSATSNEKRLTSLEEEQLWKQYYEQRFIGESLPEGQTYKSEFKRRHQLYRKAMIENTPTQALSKELKCDKEVIQAALSKHFTAFRYASDALRGDKAFVQAIVESTPMALGYASEALRSDKEVVQAALASNPWVLRYALGAAVKAAVSQNGMFLQWASEASRGDREVVQAAVSQDGMALQYASDELRNNRYLVLAAVQRHGMALQFASKEMRLNEDVAKRAIQQNPEAAQYMVHDTIKRDMANIFTLCMLFCFSSVAANVLEPYYAENEELKAYIYCLPYLMVLGTLVNAANIALTMHEKPYFSSDTLKAGLLALTGKSEGDKSEDTPELGPK